MRAMNMNSRKNQTGAVLVVALVILMVMSVIGVSSLTSSTLQERMASNKRQRSIAEFAAESALKRAERFLTNNVTSTPDLAVFTGANGLYAAYRAIGVINSLAPVPFSVTDPAAWGNTNSVEVSGLTNINTNPRYVIEYMGRDKGTANKAIFDPSNTTPSTDPHIFRITSIGWAQDTNIYAVLQSTYRTGYGSGIFVY